MIMEYAWKQTQCLQPDDNSYNRIEIAMEPLYYEHPSIMDTPLL